MCSVGSSSGASSSIELLEVDVLGARLRSADRDVDVVVAFEVQRELLHKRVVALDNL